MADGPIELRITTIEQLFNRIDAAPLRDKDLDPEAERFIVDWAREMPKDASLALTLHLPEAEREDATRAGPEEAVRTCFEELVEEEQRHLRDLLADGRLSLVIGLSVLGTCLLLVQLLAEWSTGNFSETLQEGLIIFGWVANWRPAEIFLYDWWPIRRRIRLYQRLADMPVTLAFHDAEA